MAVLDRRAALTPGPKRLLWAAISAYACGFGALSILGYRSFNVGRFDLGNMTQAVWATAHGHPLAVTNLQGEQVSRLGSHVDPILVLFAPLWWLWPSPTMLLAAQAVAVALGALPVFWLARKYLGSERAALGFALAYLLYPAVEWLTLNEFHPVALACPLLLFAFWYLDEDRLVPFAVFAALAALTKEEIPLVIAGMGVWYAVSRRRFLAGSAIAVFGVLLAGISIELVLPHFNHGASSSFYDRYGALGHSPRQIVATAFTHPGRLLSAAFDWEGLHYLADLLLPLALLFAAAPLALVAAIPELGLNLLSATDTQVSIHHHYTAGLIPPLVVASVLGAGRLARGSERRAVALAALAVVVALAANYRLGAFPLWRGLPGAEAYQAYASHVSAHDRIADRAVRLIPDGDVVSATNSLGSHLSARRRFLSFPYVRDARWIAADETQPGYADRWDPLATATDLARLRRNPRWRLVFSDDGVLVFQRRTKSTAKSPTSAASRATTSQTIRSSAKTSR
ncbi:MAG TPA: DUF2079 domain-containing protein [Gaiellaceae bacterium]|nr:DUF2079 domain-containing protein [Gaiellaceae bacterium]